MTDDMNNDKQASVDTPEFTELLGNYVAAPGGRPTAQARAALIAHLDGLRAADKARMVAELAQALGMKEGPVPLAWDALIWAVKAMAKSLEARQGSGVPVATVIDIDRKSGQSIIDAALELGTAVYTAPATKNVLTEVIDRKCAEVKAIVGDPWGYRPTDAQRYERLRILGVAPAGTKQLAAGTVLRFQNLDDFVDADFAAQPSRGEYTAPAQVEGSGVPVARWETIEGRNWLEYALEHLTELANWSPSAGDQSLLSSMRARAKFLIDAEKTLTAPAQVSELQGDAILAARAEGRAEAVEILSGLCAETGLDAYTGWSRSGAPEDEGSAYWKVEKLRELFKCDDKLHNLFDRAEAMYWQAKGEKDEAAREMRLVESAPFYKPLHDFLSKHEAWELMHDLKTAAHPQQEGRGAWRDKDTIFAAWRKVGAIEAGLRFIDFMEALNATAPIPPMAVEGSKAARLMALADRIDSEELWRRPAMKRHSMTPEQVDRHDAGVMLRRYADILEPGRWLVIPPTGPMQFSAGTFDKVVEMVRRDQARRAHQNSVQREGGES